MKLAVVLVVVFVSFFTGPSQGLTEEQKQIIQKHRDDCITDTNVNPAYIGRANKGDFVDDGKLKCFAKCFYQKTGFVDENGSLLLDEIKARLPAKNRAKSLSVIETCIQEEGEDPCETVYLVHKCYFESMRREHANR